jgi:hypothetical protein
MSAPPSPYQAASVAAYSSTELVGIHRPRALPPAVGIVWTLAARVGNVSLIVNEQELLTAGEQLAAYVNRTVD